MESVLSSFYCPGEVNSSSFILCSKQLETDISIYLQLLLDHRTASSLNKLIIERFGCLPPFPSYHSSLSLCAVPSHPFRILLLSVLPFHNLPTPIRLFLLLTFLIFLFHPVIRSPLTAPHPLPMPLSSLPVVFYATTLFLFFIFCLFSRKACLL